MVKLTEVEKQFKNENDVFPAVVVNDGSVETIEQAANWIKDNHKQLEAILKDSGALLFRGFPVESAEMFDAFSASFGYPDFTYKESLSNAVRINFTDRVFTANEAPKDVEINLHNEMAQTPIYPDKIFFFCQTPADIGGASPIMRCDMLFDALTRKDPQLAKNFEEKGVRYTTVMPADTDKNWLFDVSSGFQYFSGRARYHVDHGDESGCISIASSPRPRGLK